MQLKIIIAIDAVVFVLTQKYVDDKNFKKTIPDGRFTEMVSRICTAIFCFTNAKIVGLFVPFLLNYCTSVIFLYTLTGP